MVRNAFTGEVYMSNAEKKRSQERNDDIFEKKWSQPRVVRTEENPYKDPGIDFSNDPGLTDQTHKDDCDINVIVDRFLKTGHLPQAVAEGVYDDISTAPQYHEAMTIVAGAQQQFDTLDAKIRKRFGNDPANFLEFVSDKKNGAELVKMGLAKVVQRDVHPSSQPAPDSRRKGQKNAANEESSSAGDHPKGGEQKNSSDDA